MNINRMIVQVKERNNVVVERQIYPVLHQLIV